MAGLFKNKHGNVWINVMVLLVIAVCLATLYVFLTSSNKISAEILGVGAFNGVYLDEGYFKFYVNEAGKNAVDETYAKLGSEQIPTIDDFFVNFQKQFDNYGLNKNYLKKENFQILGNVLKLKIDNWQSEKNLISKGNNIDILYNPELNFEFKLK